MVLCKITPEEIKNINYKLEYAINIYKDFMEEDLIDK
jgi:hypothetical protein